MKNKIIIPEPYTNTEFLQGQVAKIFENVSEKENVLLANKNSKPQNVMILHDRY